MRRYMWLAVILTALGLAMGTIAFSRKLQSPAQPTTTMPELKPSLLAPHLEMGVVELNVADLAVEKRFYQEVVGLEVLNETPQEVILGFNERSVVKLVLRPDLQPAPPGSAGLYHLAIVFESRSTLAQAVESILTENPERYSGTSDHKVSEAFYFYDPEGNGVELYFDKDPSTWQWQDGRVVMGSSYIDPQTYIQQYAQTSASPAKKMGHVHLKISDVERARHFYGEIVGMSTTADLSNALFMSDGRYHHHLGMNIWESQGAGKRSETLGLKSFEIWLPDTESLNKLRERLQKAQIEFSEADQKVSVNDPWNNLIHFVIQAK